MQKEVQLAEYKFDPALLFESDERFNKLYPPQLRELANTHWTPLEVAESAADFLVRKKGDRILDIGSGTGKFCLAAAYYKPTAFFTGVEQRFSHVQYAENARQKLGFSNVSFIHENFTKTVITQYQHFYFYNSFYENITGTPKIDNSLNYSYELYHLYQQCLNRQFDKMPSGTRVASFHSLEHGAPRGFVVVGSDMNDLLKFWVKI